ncbi:SPOR domain-containing protein [Porphyrobacter algicida]|uniref:SPOR domain-containing protein n=1 Tax=Qipengyuania algicida TaxID=1836209 RepID=A0A845AM52_9SPHN|nr:SPOR domain-containing protein [Qipengyuania algicida]MXP29961.1 SPOR domain-containing protein [Qipengyuania algicida]
MSTTTTANRTRIWAFAITTALASTTLAGCAGKVAPSSAMSAEQARVALAKGKDPRAVESAQAAVLASPRDAQNRALLGAAYIQSGRFGSAETALGDAVKLGDTSARTVLAYALTQIAAGHNESALQTIDQYKASLDPANYGLAMVLAGRPKEGIDVLGRALRSGENTAKIRQNLAYSFALTGDWRTARLIAAQDLPANQLGQRLGEWAVLTNPQMAQQRIASLLGVKLANDPGQPAELALANFPSTQMLADEAATQNAAPASASRPVELASASTAELPPEAPAPSASNTSSAPTVALTLPPVEPRPASAAPIATGGKFAVNEVVEPVPQAIAKPAAKIAITHPNRTKSAANAKAKKFLAAFERKEGNFNIQLGSYFSQDDAEWAWKNFHRLHPELKGSDKVITKAVVKGKTYYRVAAGGFARNSARQMCSIVKSKGGDCFAYAGTRVLPGAISNGTQVASR